MLRRAVITSSRTVDEVRSVLRSRRGFSSDALGSSELIIRGIHVAELPSYLGLLDAAALALAEAVPSRNASAADAHLLACAWAFDADIWSHDRDFAGTGWPSWSNANLGRQLAAEPG